MSVTLLEVGADRADVVDQVWGHLTGQDVTQAGRAVTAEVTGHHLRSLSPYLEAMMIEPRHTGGSGWSKQREIT